jgi:hypothetical protein
LSHEIKNAATMLKNNLSIAVFALFFGFGNILYAQDRSPLEIDFQILSPRIMDTVQSGQLLIVVRLPVNHLEHFGSFQILINNQYDISENIRIRGQFMSAIFEGDLPTGQNTLEIFGLQKVGRIPVLVQQQPFQVSLNNSRNKKRHTPTSHRQNEIMQSPQRFSGNLYFISTEADITGSGAALRQEPPMVREVGFQFNIKAGKGEIPISGLFTTNSRDEFNYRNQFNIGYKQGDYQIAFGDQFVNYDRFTFNGIRVRGLFLQTPISKDHSKILMMYGRNVDALFVNNNFPLAPDAANAIFLAGMPRYERRYLFLQLRIDYRKNRDYSALTFVRSQDHPGDELIAGIKPEDNVTISWERFIPFAQDRGFIRINTAMSFTALDNTLPSIISDFDFLVATNATLVPLTNRRLPQFLFALGSSIPIWKGNDLIVESRRIGGSFFTHGNPYLLNNRFVTQVIDRTRLFKNRVFFNISYDYLQDNINKNQFYTRENASISGSFDLRPNEKLPALSLGYRRFIGQTSSDFEESFNLKNISLFGSLQYRLNLEPFVWQLMISRNDLNLISEVMANNRQQVNSVSISTTYKGITGASLQGMHTRQFLGNQEIPQQMAALQLWYRFKKPDVRIQLRAIRNQLNFGGLGTERRQGLQAGIDYNLLKYLNLSVNGGFFPVVSFDDSRNYSERFLQIRGMLMF